MEQMVSKHFDNGQLSFKFFKNTILKILYVWSIFPTHISVYHTHAEFMGWVLCIWNCKWW